MAALDHPRQEILAPETDAPLELQEYLGLCEHRGPLPADKVEDSCRQPPSGKARYVSPPAGASAGSAVRDESGTSSPALWLRLGARCFGRPHRRRLAGRR